ncbi:MAG: RagB/SusD family nutrient uptake outer membrane protein [Gemmatimonadota bacterium]|nr:RagB/SusD family nutrient uptake outer membrane protein [Gemmatimonadota bacterium]MDE2866116.1 RagB/SusD family nutrient uptake outer membrane protein [Gemmatimonadota bacterium]MXV96056.1 RagB/SusD family nutrient uptake outer membrane protein [Gemmatimonadota bacterium]MYB05248.1 RagB/SusD family nutrient uptake outer membrane protein [Gemmatimonadota bacterium]MYE15605.1 RagB/SusD family nutrient uptake outer membrane protein [Gemmatimonadota bacterium]
MTNRPKNRSLSTLARTGLLGLAVAAIAGCGALDELLSVDAPSRVSAADLENPATAGLLVASVANEFRCTLTYYAAASALTGNEWRDASNNSVLNIWDQRVHDTSGYGSQYASADCGSGQPALYRPMSRTRWLADYTLGLLSEWTTEEVPDKAAYEAEVALYAGYSYILFGESMCSVAFDEGPEQMPADAFNLAIARFDQAMAAGASGDILHAAQVGKARAQLNLNQKSAAMSTASSVPDGFAFELHYSNAEAVTRNKLWEFNIDHQNVTVAEPYRDVRFADTPDPRVAVNDANATNSQTGIAIFVSEKYPEPSSPIEMAGYAEAQLIVAEAHIEAGNLDGAVSIFNGLHRAAGLPAYEGDMTATALMTQLIYERAAENYLEGQHLQDLKRLNIPLYPPTGTDDGFGGAYGDEICFELPATEFQNNPSISGG